MTDKEILRQFINVDFMLLCEAINEVSGGAWDPVTMFCSGRLNGTIMAAWAIGAITADEWVGLRIAADAVEE